MSESGGGRREWVEACRVEKAGMIVSGAAKEGEMVGVYPAYGEGEGEDSFDEDDDRRILQATVQANEEDEELEDLNSPSPSSSDDETHRLVEVEERPEAAPPTAPPARGAAIPGTLAIVSSIEAPSPKRQRIFISDGKKPTMALDDSRRLFQRLWTDEDELGLLQGFLEYTMLRRQSHPSSHHDTTSFYDQIKDRLQLDFNKNQLVEKLRRLKKKYRNVLSRIGSGKEFAFKSPHDQATFEISRKIWSTPSAVAETFDDEDGNLHMESFTNSDRKAPRSSSRPQRKRPSLSMEENLANDHPAQPHPTTPIISTAFEEAMRNCLSPLFKELFCCFVNGGPANSGILGGLSLNPLPLNFCGNGVNLGPYDGMDDKWRKQQILELEVYSKRLELLQEQIRSALEDLRSMEDNGIFAPVAEEASQRLQVDQDFFAIGADGLTGCRS